MACSVLILVAHNIPVSFLWLSVDDRILNLTAFVLDPDSGVEVGQEAGYNNMSAWEIEGKLRISLAAI